MHEVSDRNTLDPRDVMDAEMRDLRASEGGFQLQVAQLRCSERAGQRTHSGGLGSGARFRSFGFVGSNASRLFRGSRVSVDIPSQIMCAQT